jgi:hypothetical protein
MIYMVEMQFTNTAREHDWHTWYLAHTTKLVRNVPGFTATQRFRAITDTASPWLAMHEVEGPAVFESAAYKANGGPASTGIWQNEHTNWYRNLFGGIDQTPDVKMDQHLLLADEGAKLPPSLKMKWLPTAGLDKTVKARGIAIAGTGQWAEARLTADLFDVPGLRIFKPITPRIGR